MWKRRLLRLFSSPANNQLIKAFDTKIAPKPNTQLSNGLFGIDGLLEPKDLAEAAKKSIQQATQMVELVCLAETVPDLRKTIKRVDCISDVLCSVLDPSEFIRNVHPNEEWVSVAHEVCSALHSFLSQLNTHPGLYHVSLLLRSTLASTYLFFLISYQ